MNFYILSAFFLILLTIGVLYLFKYNCIIALIAMLLPISLTFWGFFSFKRNLKSLMKAFLNEEIWNYIQNKNGLLVFLSLLASFQIVISFIRLYPIFSLSIKTLLLILLSVIISFFIGIYLSKHLSQKLIKEEFREILEPILGIILAFIPLFVISLVTTTLDFFNTSVNFDIVEISNKAYSLIKSDCIIIRVLSRIFFFIDQLILSLTNAFDSIFFKIFAGLIYFFYASLIEYIPLYYLLFGLILLIKSQEPRR